MSISYALGALLLSTGVAVSSFVLAQRQLLAETEEVATDQMFRNARDLRRDLQLEAAAAEIPVILEGLVRTNNAQVLLLLKDSEPRSLSGLEVEDIPVDLRAEVIPGRAAKKRFQTAEGAQFASGVFIGEIGAEYYEILPLTETEGTLATLRRILIGASATATILGAGLGYYLARRILQPVTNAAQAA